MTQEQGLGTWKWLWQFSKWVQSVGSSWTQKVAISEGDLWCRWEKPTLLPDFCNQAFQQIGKLVLRICHMFTLK